MEKTGPKEVKRWTRPLALLVTLTLVVIAGTAGCGKSATSTGSSTGTETTKAPVTTKTPSTGAATTTKATAPAGPRIIVRRAGLSQEALIIPAGTTVTFVNNDSSGVHRLVADNGGFDTGILKPGGFHSVSFGSRGVFTFKDRTNPAIHGEIIVQ